MLCDERFVSACRPETNGIVPGVLVRVVRGRNCGSCAPWRRWRCPIKAGAKVRVSHAA